MSTESARISQTRCSIVVLWVPTTTSHWYSWLRSSPSRATCAPLERVATNAASLPNATHRCHSVRDSQVPASFSHDVFVARENTAMFIALLTYFSASPPKKPMSVILLRYIHFSCSTRLSRAPGSEWARLPGPEAAFLGEPARGSQNRNGGESKAEASQAPGAARAPKQCRDKGWMRKRTRNRRT